MSSVDATSSAEAGAPVNSAAGNSTPGNSTPGNSARYQIGLTALLSLNFGFVLFDRNASSFLMPFIQPDLGLNNTQVGLLSGALSLTWAIAAFGIGVVSDRMGSRKGLLILSTLAFSLCSFGSGLVTTFTMLLCARLLMGAAEGGIMPISQALVASEVDARHRGLAMGVAQGFGSSLLGSFVAPVMLVAFAEAFGWRHAFFLAGVPGLAIALLMAWFIRAPRAAGSPSRAASAPRAGSPPREPAPRGELVSGAESEPRERRATTHTLEARSFRAAFAERNVLLCAILSILLVSYLVVCWSFMPLYLTQVRHYDPSTMAWLMGALGISATVASFAIPGLSDRIGRRGLMIVMPLIAVLLPLAAMYYTGPVWGLAAVFVIGWLVTGTFPLFMATVPAESVDARHIAGALGICMGTGELIGGVLSPFIAGYAADAVGLQAPLWIMSGLALCAGIVAFGVRETAPRALGRRASPATIEGEAR